MADDERELVYTQVEVASEDWDYQGLTDELQTFLREAGTPEELRLREARMLFEFGEILKSVPAGELSEEQRFFVRETMTIMRAHLTKLRSQAEWAVAMLTREGFRYDEETKRFERLEGFNRMRRRRFAEDVIEAYRYGDNRGNTRATRVQIAEALKGIYPDLMLSARAYFPIWHCLNEFLGPNGAEREREREPQREQV